MIIREGTSKRPSTSDKECAVNGFARLLKVYKAHVYWNIARPSYPGRGRTMILCPQSLVGTEIRPLLLKIFQRSRRTIKSVGYGLETIASMRHEGDALTVTTLLLLCVLPLL